jgi:hypothetical protein
MYIPRSHCCPHCYSYLAWDDMALAWYCGACNDYPYSFPVKEIDDGQHQSDSIPARD